MIEEAHNNNGLEDNARQERPDNDLISLSPETEIERIPTFEEIESVLKKLIGKECAEVFKLEDEKGVYRYDVRIHGDSPGESTGYEYMRKKKGYSIASVIDIVYYEKDKDGKDIAVHGSSVANWVNGNWKIV